MSNRISPTISESWILDNIRSIISNQTDELNNTQVDSDSSLNNNDNTLTDSLNFLYSNKNGKDLPNEANNDLLCDSEIEKMRTFSGCENIDRIPKRPFSPEEIEDQNFCQFQPTQIYNGLNNPNHQSISNNLDFDNVTNLLFDFHNQNIHNSYSLNQSDYNDLNLLNNNEIDFSSAIKKKKLNRTSSSNILPTFSITQPEFNSNPISFFDKSFTNQFNNNEDSNYYSNSNSPSNMSKSNSYLSLSNQSQCYNNSYLMTRRSSLSSLNNQHENQIDINSTSTPFNNKYLCSKSNMINSNDKNIDSEKNFAHYNIFNLNNESLYKKCETSYENILNSKNPSLDESLNITNSKQYLDLNFSNNNAYNKRITKSSSSLFNDRINKGENYFVHSTSYDNIGQNANFKFRTKQMNSTCSSYDFGVTNNEKTTNFSYNSYLETNKSSHDYNYHYKWNNNHNSSCLSNNKISSNFKQQNQQTNNIINISCRNNSNGQTPSSIQNNHRLYDSKDQIVLHVKNLDYKISSDEWKRILLENFRKHCKENLSVNVITNSDKSLLGIVKLANKEDAKLAISCLHHKKIGYKRLNVNIAYSSNSNSPKSKIVALLKSNESNEMALTRFIEMYEQRYNQSITLSELFKLKEIVHISQSKDGNGRQIRLILKNYHHNLENDMQELLHTPFCSIHSHQKFDLTSKKDLESKNNSSIAGWLPNVVVSLRSFKSAVHKLLNDHGGQMPLLSFLECYKYCILNDSNNSTNSINRNNLNKHEPNTKSEISTYQLQIDNENGIPLEHLITCAQDVQIQLNDRYYKQLQWENDKSRPLFGRGLSKNHSSNSLHASNTGITPSILVSQFDQSEYFSDFDDSTEESQRKINLFSHEVVELLKTAPRCIIPLSKFNNEYHKKYGKQCRVADYGFTKLIELLEAIPHILQILDGQFEKKLTLTHRVQVRRFSNDLIKVLKANSTKQMFADEFPAIYEKHFSKQFDICDYGVCYLEDMLAELPESIIFRKEVDGRTFIQIPKIIQLDKERLCTQKLTYDVIDMLKHKPRFSIQFNKFIPNFHHHFGRQCKLSNYGFSKLIELLEAMSDTVQLFSKDGLQFVQLKKKIMIELITQNIVKLIEESNFKLDTNLKNLEKLYNSKYEAIYYNDFDCNKFSQFYSLLSFEKFGIKTLLISSLPNQIDYQHYYNNLNNSKNYKKNNNFVDVNENIEWSIQLEPLHDKEVKKFCKLILKKMMEGLDEHVVKKIDQFKKLNKNFFFKDLLDLILMNCADLSYHTKFLNKRAYFYMIKLLSDFFIIKTNEIYDYEINIDDLSDLYLFAKEITSLYTKVGLLDMTINDLENLYKHNYRGESNQNSISIQDYTEKGTSSSFPFRKLGFIDVNLLFSQGLSLIVTIKRYDDITICLNKEFWPPCMSPNLIECYNSENSNIPFFQRFPSSVSAVQFSKRY